MRWVSRLFVVTSSAVHAIEQWERLYQKANPKAFAKYVAEQGLPLGKEYVPAFNCSATPGLVDTYAMKHVCLGRNFRGKVRIR